MRKNTFITTPYIKNYLFKNLIIVFLKYAQMHQNTYITTSDVKKYLFKELDSGGLKVCENAPKHVFYHSIH
jgi:hypothetical protein